MIDKKRLQELITQEETVWCISELWGSNKLKLHNKDVRDSDCFHISKTLLLSDSIEFYDEEETYRVPFQLLFETQQEYLNHKEEVEWVAKMHAQRTELFEPPIYDEIIKDSFITVDYEDGYRFMTKDGHIAYITYNEYSDGTADFEVGGNWVGYKRFEPATKDNYIKACEYARNLFIGKEK